jgi:peptide/nickel transport system substrate-binding protein
VKKKCLFVVMSFFLISTLKTMPSTVNPREAPRGAVDTPLIYGTIGLVVNLDPHEAWDRASIDHINQVGEGLYAYNLRSSDVEIVHRLAASCGTWSANKMEFTVPLRTGVTFHDGSVFNASAVKWNFDRLNAFIEGKRTQIAELYTPLADLYPTTPLLINETVVVDEFTVRFMLNYPFVALMALLCFSGSAIISPSSVANTSEFLQVGTDLLVGTGPYIHVNTTTEKTVFKAYANYYRGTPAVQHMEWIKYENITAASNALIAGEIDLGDVSTDFLNEFEISPDVTVGQSIKGIEITYMGLNNKFINKTLRQVISYAIDYEYMIEDLQDGEVARMISPVPEVGARHYPNVQPVAYNVTKARLILIDVGLSKGLTVDSPDQDWLDLVDRDPIASYSYWYGYGNDFHEEFGILVKLNCKMIGIKILLFGCDPIVIRDHGEEDMFCTGWSPPYNDPSIFINSLFWNTSDSNLARVNDPWLQIAMREALEETDSSIRYEMYIEIQKYIVEDLMPCVFLYVPIITNVLADTITNWNFNPMGQLDFYSATFMEEDTVITAGYREVDCGFELPWHVDTWPTQDTETTTTDETIPVGIPGYSLVAFFSVMVLTIMSIGYKHQKKSPNVHELVHEQ